MSRLSRQCWILKILQPYRPPRPVTGIALLFTFLPNNKRNILHSKVHIFSEYWLTDLVNPGKVIQNFWSKARVRVRTCCLWNAIIHHSLKQEVVETCHEPHQGEHIHRLSFCYAWQRVFVCHHDIETSWRWMSASRVCLLQSFPKKQEFFFFVSRSSSDNLPWKEQKFGSRRIVVH
jgi:hypothetical protein